MYEGPGPDDFHNSGRIQFSSTGSKLFYYNGSIWRKMRIYDFDRCTGELGNFREIDFTVWIAETSDFRAFALSPDASKIS